MSSFSDYPMVTTTFSEEAKQIKPGVGVSLNSDQQENYEAAIKQLMFNLKISKL